MGDTGLLGTMATEIRSPAALPPATTTSSALTSLVLLAWRLAGLFVVRLAGRLGGRLSGRFSARLGARLGARLDVRLSRASVRLSGLEGGARDGVRLKSIFVEPLNTGQMGSSGVCIAAEAGKADTGLFQ